MINEKKAVVDIFYKIQKNIFGQLICCLILAYIMSDYVSLIEVRVFYTLSIIIVELIVFFLPFIVTIYFLYSLMLIRQNAFSYIISLLSAIFFSNFCSMLAAYSIGHYFLYSSAVIRTNHIFNQNIIPLITLPFSNLVNIQYTSITPLILYLFLIFLPLSNKIKHKLNASLFFAQELITILLSKLLIPILPLYVFGYALKLFYESTFSLLIKDYLPIIAMSISLIVTYLLLLYLLASKIAKKKFSHIISNMIPAGLTAFVTMSSTATLPLTLLGVEKNLKNSKLAKLITISTVNIHIIGDNIIITNIAVALSILFGQGMPDFNNFLIYIFYISLINLSCIGIPGGCILIILPILQKVFGISGEIASILTILYFLHDPLITVTNVLGNGAFAILFEKFLQKLKVFSQ